jgi:hypothetical protein
VGGFESAAADVKEARKEREKRFLTPFLNNALKLVPGTNFI